MKNLKFIFVLLFGMSTIYIQAQEDDKPPFTGENFSLEGALAMFKQSSSLEDFEKRINSEDNNVNNLDFNQDDEIDYVMVEDNIEDGNHLISLSTYLNENDKQEIATILIEKSDEDFAVMQIIGNEKLYAENTVVEPYDGKEEVTPSKGPFAGKYSVSRIIVNVWMWPCVQFLYAPTYVVWVSPHRWRAYPVWWRPWRPYRYSVFYGRVRPHHVYYHRVKVNRRAAVRAYNHQGRGRTTVIKNGRNGNTTVIRNHRGGNTAIITKGNRGGGRSNGGGRGRGGRR